jgi:acyl transferase domain-containing protein
MTSTISGSSNRWHLIALTADTDLGLEKATDDLIANIKIRPHRSLADIACAHIVDRISSKHRRILVCRDREDALRALELRDPKRVISAAHGGVSPPVIFMFPGLGGHFVNMALGIYQFDKNFRELIDNCFAILKTFLDCDLKGVLFPGCGKDDKGDRDQTPHMVEEDSFLDFRRMLQSVDREEDESSKELNQTVNAHPILFVIEYGLAKLWMKWGVYPRGMIGYSLGEYVAACLAGVFSLEDALFLVAERAKMIEKLPGGAMLAVALSKNEVEPLLGENLYLSAINGPSLSVISGAGEDISNFAQEISEKGVISMPIQTSRAFHSKMMEPIRGEFTEMVKKICLKPPEIPYISNVTGTWIKAEEATDPGYWAMHLSQPVWFGAGINELWKDPRRVLLEVGAGNTLSALAIQHPASPSLKERVVLTSLPHKFDGQPDLVVLFNSLGRLWLEGIDIDWSFFYGTEYPPPKQLSAGASTENSFEKRSLCGKAESGQFYFPTSPSGEVERRIVKIWKELLPVNRVEIDDNFFSLGGNVQLGTQYIFKIQEIFRVDLTLVHLIAEPTVAGQALIVEKIILEEIDGLTDDEVKRLL